MKQTYLLGVFSLSLSLSLSLFILDPSAGYSQDLNCDDTNVECFDSQSPSTYLARVTGKLRPQPFPSVEGATFDNVKMRWPEFNHGGTGRGNTKSACAEQAKITGTLSIDGVSLRFFDIPLKEKGSGYECDNSLGAKVEPALEISGKVIKGVRGYVSKDSAWVMFVDVGGTNIAFFEF